jgi:tryptophan synthase beta chain
MHVYMVKISYQQKPHRRTIMETFGATVYASPSDDQRRAHLAKHPDSTGSLGIAISEAVRRRPPAAASTSIRSARCSITC